VVEDVVEKWSKTDVGWLALCNPCFWERNLKLLESLNLNALNRLVLLAGLARQRTNPEASGIINTFF